ncbi:MAG: hypothetical protein ACK5ZU_16465 [Acidobacteriota bacterium]
MLTRRLMFMTLALVGRGREGLRVELYWATECPIAGRYVPEVKRMMERHGDVVFEFWFPEEGLTEARLERWKGEYGVKGAAARRDEGAGRARRAGARMTPEAVVWMGERVVYRGRIDDRYVGWGKAKGAPERRDVEEVIAAWRAGREMKMREARGYGCVIEGVK